MDHRERHAFAIDVARRAGAFALDHFRAIDTLAIETKGHQDLVSNADRDTETLVREAIAQRFPDDGIVGEEHGRVRGTSGHDWVIDPIDGTANFVRGIPQWCVAIACVHDGRTVAGAVFEPSSGEMFEAVRGGGARVDGRPMRASGAVSLAEGSVMVGVSGRTDAKIAAGLVGEIVGRGGMFFRNASGALGLSYVAAGRLLGYVENHMHAWDCLAALLMIEEAGGTVSPLDAGVIDKGTRVVAGGAGIHGELEAIATAVFGPRRADVDRAAPVS